MATFTPSPFTGAHINSQNWLPILAVPIANHSLSRRVPSRSRTKRPSAGRPMEYSVISHIPAAMVSIRRANTSVPPKGFIQWLNR